MEVCVTSLISIYLTLGSNVAILISCFPRNTGKLLLLPAHSPHSKNEKINMFFFLRNGSSIMHKKITENINTMEPKNHNFRFPCSIEIGTMNQASFGFSLVLAVQGTSLHAQMSNLNALNSFWFL